MTTDVLNSLRLSDRFEGWAFRQHIDTYILRMQAQCFSARYTYRAVRIVGEFARWLIDIHGNGFDVGEGTAASFLDWRQRRPGYCHGTCIAISRLLDVLRGAHAIAPPSLSRDPRDLLVEDYRRFLEDQRGFRTKSSASYVWFARPFVHELWTGDANGLAGHLRGTLPTSITEPRYRRAKCSHHSAGPDPTSTPIAR